MEAAKSSVEGSHGDPSCVNDMENSPSMYMLSARDDDIAYYMAIRNIDDFCVCAVMRGAGRYRRKAVCGRDLINRSRAIIGG